MYDRPADRYFVRAQGVQLVVVLLAFAPTFFLRPYLPWPPILDMAELPAGFVVHGGLLTARLMLFAGITFLFAATARLGGIVSSVVGVPVGPLVGFGILLGLTLSLAVHNRRTLGRVTPVTRGCLAA